MILEECIKVLGGMTLMSSNKLAHGSHSLEWMIRSWIVLMIALEDT